MAKNQSLTNDKDEQSIKKAEPQAEIWGEVDYEFHGQRAGESVMMVAKQHPMVNMPAVIIAIVVAIIPYLSIRMWGASMVSSVLIFLYLIFILVFLGTRLYLYFQSVNILTSQRIIVAGQLSLFSRKISEAELSRIQDVSTEIKGVWETLFGFGDVVIRTASSETLIKLAKVPAPYDIQQAIVRTLNEHQKQI